MAEHALEGPTPILDAVYRRDAVTLEALLAARPALTIFEAAAVGDVARVRALLAAEPALAGARSDDGWTALHLAGHFGHADVVDALLAGGADVRAWSTNPLVETLLARGGDPTARTDDGKTARMIAEAQGRALVARRLRGEEP
jgi:ankyrin repeat protein